MKCDRPGEGSCELLLELLLTDLQSQVNSVYQSGPLKVIGQFSHDGIG